MTLTSTEQPELLPCPLCGGDVKHEVWSDRNYHKVECQDCGLDVDYCTSYAELAAFWNRRTPEAQAGRVAPRKLPQVFIDKLAAQHGLDFLTYTPFAWAVSHLLFVINDYSL